MWKKILYEKRYFDSLGRTEYIEYYELGKLDSKLKFEYDGKQKVPKEVTELIDKMQKPIYDGLTDISLEGLKADAIINKLDDEKCTYYRNGFIKKKEIKSKNGKVTMGHYYKYSKKRK